MPGPAEVSWAELALDYEAFVGRALPASPDHRLRGACVRHGQFCGGAIDKSFLPAPLAPTEIMVPVN